MTLKVAIFIAIVCMAALSSFDLIQNAKATKQVIINSEHRNLTGRSPQEHHSQDDRGGSETVNMYNQSTIETSFSIMKTFEPMLLVFNGERFLAYDMSGYVLNFRYVVVIPLLVHALRTKHPERFMPGMPVFEIVFTTADYLMTDCVNKPCPSTKDFPPIVSFATVHQDERIFPTAKAFPHSPYTARCLYEYKMHGVAPCQWASLDQNIPWEDLKETIIWRGTDFHAFVASYKSYEATKMPWMDKKVFIKDAVKSLSQTEMVDKLFQHYQELSPRWKAAALSLRAKAYTGQPPWIDVMFTGKNHQDVHSIFAEKGLPVASEPMNAREMSHYKYQVDLGGGGGTTWEGTLTKLGMPGVLFHHTAPTKDWFYDLMEPWRHYIPLKEDVADLWEKYVWAQEHEEEVHRIAQESSKLAEYLLSAEYMDKLYNDLFDSWLGELTHAYQPMDLNWEDYLKLYEKKGIKLRLVSECNDVTCKTQWEEGKFIDNYAHASKI